MIARWMFASLLFAILTGLAALAAERALRAMRRQQRIPWAIALVAAATWPVIAPIVALFSPPPAVEVSALTVSTVEPLTVVASSDFAFTQHLDTALLASWAVLSLMLLLRVAAALRTLHVERRRARAMQLDGEQVLVAPSLGPAVVGVVSPRIVVPEWLLELDVPLRALVIRHEREHCRAGDARLVWLGVVATVLMPWNPGVWWIARRLRLAMEIDCDARTLRGATDHAGYARLLLLIAQRQSATGHPRMRLAPMLAESSSHLGRRISAMRSAPVSHPVLRAAALVGVACGAVLVACSPRIAGNLTGPAPAPAPTSPSDVAVADSATATASPQSKPYFDFQVNKPATMRPGTRGPTYPPELRTAGVQGAVLAQFVVNADGTVDSTSIRILKSDHPGLVDAVRGALSAMTFLPAEVKGTNVRQLLQMPFQFKLDTPGAFVGLGPATMPAPTAGTAARDANPQSRDAPRPSGARSPVTAPNDNSLPYFDFQTTKPATMLAGSVGPEYPPSLRATGVEGGVLAQFVVDETGRPLVSTFKVLRSDHELFTESVKQALERLRFTPADVKGKPVKQLVQQPFQFSLSR